ncbi:tripartite tricarboxylate transporter substrate binding protein [Zwartia sp.]|uniref:Bug family tripartite tricarboxylate transporter substrate binding protein n=1 Tax=Zwartia sp. TaxID=2978004 RepID=UPI002727FB6C|nr:tripartite tricarboxylate transporter substrate binding protein [Zwartia sp.]MDO9023719.1 tripartite tricarboxylate transporter substrate binding protein [Zwartia sp.]
MIRRKLLATMLAVLGTASVNVAFAQGSVSFTKPIKLVVPFAPGGTSDILARMIAPKLSATLKQTVVVENRPGAAGNLGASIVAKSDPDGHTLLLMDLSSLAVAPHLYTTLTYNPVKDLAPVSMISFSPYLLAVNPKLGVKTVAELLAFGKKNPDKLVFAHAGVGSGNQIVGLELAKHWGIQWVTVPYKGGSAAINAVLAGEANVIVNGSTATLPYVKNGQLVALAVSGEKRFESLPDVPTYRELKLPAADSGSWQGVLVASGTPAPVVAKLNAEINTILRDPEVVARIASQGATPVPMTPQALAKWMQESSVNFGKVIRENNLKIE